MIIQNKTNNKKLTVTKKQWDSFSRIVKNNHTVIDASDVEAKEQKQFLKVEKVEKVEKMKTPPDSGNKKSNL